MPHPIALLSDFGIRDPYAGIAKAVMSSIAPGAPLIDITHDVPPQNVTAASFVLAAALPYLADGTVVWAVVDPGVGTNRAAVAVTGTMDGRHLTLIVPDNGLLTESLDLLEQKASVRLDDPAFYLAQTSATFHGRDVFAPAAAHAARGTLVSTMGTASDPASLVRLPLPAVTKDAHGWQGAVRWIDRFGDLITNIPGDTARAGSWRVRAGRATVHGVSHTFGSVPPGEAVAYVGSWGTLEIAIRGGDAATRFELAIGDEVRLQPG